jgi:hypothetical protein
MANNTFRLWPANKANCEKRFDIVLDGEKGFLRIYPVDDPTNATVVSEKDLDRVVFLTASTSTFDRNRILLTFKRPQKWDFVAPGSETVFVMIYCRSDDYETTPEQDQEALDFVNKLQKNYLEEQEFVVAKKQKNLEGDASGHQTADDDQGQAEEDSQTLKRKRVNDDFIKEIEAAGTDMIQGMVVENINNAIVDLYGRFDAAFNTVSHSIVDPEAENEYFASFTKGDIPYHFVSSTNGKLLLAIHAAILCRRYVLINLEALATVVFHHTNSVESTLRGTRQTNIYFVYKTKRDTVCVKSLNEIDVDALLMYLQGLDHLCVVCCKLQNKDISSQQLKRLCKLTLEDAERLFDGKPAITDAQKCLQEIDLIIPLDMDDELSSDDDRSDDEDWEEETEIA